MSLNFTEKQMQHYAYGVYYYNYIVILHFLRLKLHNDTELIFVSVIDLSADVKGSIEMLLIYICRVYVTETTIQYTYTFGTNIYIYLSCALSLLNIVS